MNIVWQLMPLTNPYNW